MILIDVGAVEDFPEGIIRIVSIDNREIGVLRWRGRWFALRNICPHLGGPVCAGPVQAFYTEDLAWSDDLLVDAERPVLTCPWHHWQYDLGTGESMTGRERIRTYPVSVSEGRIMIQIQRTRAAAT